MGRAEGIDKASAVLNGTATAVGNTTLTDSTKTWTVNEFTGLYVYIRSGTGTGQRRLIASNTANQLTSSVAWTTNPDTTPINWTNEAQYVFDAAGNRTGVTLTNTGTTSYTANTLDILVQSTPS